jgi:hypothetical protein
MIYAHARGRYLAAIGLTSLGAAFAVAGCHGSEPTATPPPPPTTATATGSATAAAHHTAAWVPAVEPVPMDEKPRPGVGMCPHGPFCVPQPATAGEAPAPAPNQMCASTVAIPAGIGPEVSPGGRVPSVTFDPARTTTERAADPAACCYRWNVLCVGGRALRGEEGPVTAPAARRGDWLAAEGAVEVADLAPAVREALAAHWAREAAFEHASVASFARASLALLAVGAPPELVGATHAAALDEIEHARLTYALASAYGGKPTGPAALDVGDGAGRATTLVSLAVETFLDACAGESAAALALREAAALAEDGAVRAVLVRIADDEERHAELAWHTVAWALRAGGDGVARALATAMDSLRAEAAEPSEQAGDEALARHGVLGEGAQRAIRRRAIAEVVIPCGEALLAA